jgi:Fe-S-cluster containining protein
MRRRLPVYLEHSIGAVTMEATRLALEFHREIEKKAKTTCTTGCSACCSFPLDVSFFEGVSIYRALIAAGRWTPALKVSLQTHAKATGLLPAHIWMLSRIPCPLLDRSECMVYASRPFACRTTFSKGDPYHCDPHRFGPQTGLFPKEAVIARFAEFETRQARLAKIPSYRLPVSKALLLVDQVVHGEIDVDNLFAAFYASYQEAR